MTQVIESRFDDTPAMPELKTANHLLGDRKALDEAWERDGYWFFRDVLDKDAVARARAVFIETLEELGVVEPGHEDAGVYNGAPLDDFPIKMGGDPAKDPLLAKYPREVLTEDPQVKAFFEQVFGDEVFWVPNSEFHAAPPSVGGFEYLATTRGDKSTARFNYIHADGPNNKALPLKVCWIPLAPIDEEIGGLAVTEGLHRPRLGDFARPSEGIDPADVPLDAWRRAEYRPGDVLIFSLESPHTGLKNRSERYFRLSMDIRGMPKSGNVPVVGTLAAVDANAIAVKADDGSEHVFRIDQDTFYRVARGARQGIPLNLDEIPQQAKVGDRIFVAADHGTALFVRPQH